MKPNCYALVERCVCDGVNIGIARARKHSDKPTDDQLRAHIEQAIIDQFCEWFSFDDEPRGAA